MNKRRLLTITAPAQSFVLLYFLIPFTALAQQSTSPRPKIGIASKEEAHSV